MNAIDFILQDTNLKRTKGLEKAVSLLEEGFSFGEVFYTPEVWVDKGLGFWNLDKLSNSYQNLKTFKLKKEKYLKDVNSRQTPPEGAADLIVKTKTFAELEDAFRPFKRKKKTKATLAREAGLLEFANLVAEKASKGESFENGLESEAKKYIQPALGFITFETVLKGAQDILVEQGLDNIELRSSLLEDALKNAKIVISAGDKLKDGGRYSNFVKAPIQTCAYYLNPKNYDKFPQIKKAWEDGFLKVTLDFSMDNQVEAFRKTFVADGTGDLADFLKLVSKKALDIHALPSVTTEVFDKFYNVSKSVYLSKLKSDYMSLLSTPAFGKKSVLSILERENQTASLVFVSHEGEFVSSTLIDFSKEDVFENLKGLIEGITKNVELGCVAISLGGSVRKFEKLTTQALVDLKKSDSVPIVMADPRGLAQYINQIEAKFGFEDKIDNSSLAGFHLARRVQNPICEYGAHSPATLLDVPNFMNKEEVDLELKRILDYYICSLGLSLKDVNWGLLKNLGWFKFEEESGLEELSKKIVISDATDKKGLESIFSTEDFLRYSKFFRFDEALNILDSSRVFQKSFAKIKDFFKEEGVTLLKGPVVDLYKKVDEKWKKLLGEEYSSYLAAELASPFKDFRKAYRVFSFSKSVEELEQVKEDNLYWGVVTKFSAFGAFVDTGVGVEGLIHLSELSNDYISDARRVLKLGQWVLVKAIKVDPSSKKLSFSKTKAEKTFSKKNNERDARSSGGRSDNRSGGYKGNGNSSGKRPTRKFDKDSKNGSAAGRPQNRKPKQPFNNPFAALKLK